MDYYRIIQRPGYRREDLDEEDRQTLELLDDLADAVRATDAGEIDEEADESTVIGAMKRQIIEKTIGKLWEDLQLKIAEFQIGLAEGERYLKENPDGNDEPEEAGEALFEGTLGARAAEDGEEPLVIKPVKRLFPVTGDVRVKDASADVKIVAADKPADGEGSV